MDAPRSIIIVKLSSIGDVLHAVPVAVALKRHFATARIGWVVEGRAADVLAGHPAIDHLFRLPRGWLTSPGTVWDLRHRLRDFRADVALDLQGLLKSGVATWLTGARLRIGHAPPTAREGSWLACTCRVKTTATHVVEQHLDLLAALGMPRGDASFDMPHWAPSRARMQAWLAGLRLGRQPVLLNPGAGWASKRWPPERFAVLAQALIQRSGCPSVVAWAGAEEHAVAQRIAAESRGAAVVAPATSLQDLGELCRLVRVVVSGDTGPLHLAAAVGTPCVGLFGPVPASRNGPHGPQHVCVEPPPALRPPWEDRKTDTLAMLGIDVEQVAAAVDSVLVRSQAA